MSLEEQIAEAVDPTVFVRLCNALLQAEHGHAFQVIDGTRGDDGNDGWLESQRRMFAIYCPVKPETRTTANYRRKALDDLRKAAALRDSQAYRIERWTFITPRKLANELIVEIRKAAGEVGIDANHVEATFLGGLLLKHQQLLQEFPEYLVSRLEEKLDKVLASAEVKKPQPSRTPEHDIFSFHSVKKAAVQDEALKEVITLRESTDKTVAKLALRALYYRATNPVVQINAVAGLMDSFDPATDDIVDLASLCETARGAARRIASKSSEFGRLLTEHLGMEMADQAVGMSLQDPSAVARRRKRLDELLRLFAEAFTSALELAHEAQSGPAMAAVLIAIGNAAGQRAIVNRQFGPKHTYEHERAACKSALLGARDIYAELGDEYELANVQLNLANQLRFFGEIEEAMVLVKSIIPVAEKYDDADLRLKAGWLEESLRTGKIPDYMAGERRE